MMTKTHEILRALKEKRIDPYQAREALTALRTSAVETTSTADTPRPEPIAVIGMSGRYAAAADLSSLWDLLVDGQDGVRDIPSDRWAPGPGDDIQCARMGYLDEIDRFDPYFFEISPSEAEMMSPAHRIFLEEGYRAFEDAGIPRQELRGTKCGVYLGLSTVEYQMMAQLAGAASSSVTSVSNAIAGGRLPYFLDLRGPAVTLDTACSSSLVSIHLAAQALRSGEIDLALAGGSATYLSRESYKKMHDAGMLSPSGRCAAFSEDADGFVPGEGAGAVVLKRLSDAERDGDHIWGLIIASGTNQDGHTNGITAPNLGAQQELIQEVHRRFDVDPDSISYAELHGTGTKLGDPIELEALSSAFRARTARTQFCTIGSVKSNLGHVSESAGVASLQKVLLCMEHGQLVPTLHVGQPNPHFDFDTSPFVIGTTTQRWDVAAGQPRRACISSFGFSGTNAHVVVEEYQAPSRAAVVATPEVLVLSAPSLERARVMAGRLDEFLERHPDTRLEDVAFTLQTGRTPARERIAIVVDNLLDARRLLRAVADGEETPDVEFGRARRDNSAPTPGTDPHEIARAWVLGADVHWETLHTGSEPRRISLPTYPFEKHRCWFAPSPTGSAEAVARTVVVSGRETEVVQHTVKGVPTLPAAAIIEIIREASCVAQERPMTELRDVTLRSPIFCSDGVTLEVAHDPQGHFELRPCGALAPSCSGEIGYGATTPSSIDLRAVSARCNQRVVLRWDEPGCAFGVGYGPAFRLLRELHVGTNEAIAQLADGPRGEGERALAATILDSAWQAVGPLMAPDEVPAMPFHIERIAFPGSLTDAEIVHVTRHRHGGFDVRVADSDGNVLVDCHGLTLAPLASPANQSLTLLAPQWVESPAPKEATAATPVLLVADAEDLKNTEEITRVRGTDTAEIVRALEQRPHPVVVVATRAPAGDTAQAVRERVGAIREVTAALATARPRKRQFLIHLHEGAHPADAAVSGYLTALEAEDPRFQTRSIEVETLPAGEDLLALVAEETATTGSRVRRTGSTRQKRGFVELPVATDNAVFADGIFLVTGAPGGLATRAAEHIQARGGHVVLSGRRELDPIASRKLRPLLDAGAVYLPADLGDAAAVSQMVDAARSVLGRLDGVLHVAGRTRDALALHLTSNDVEEVLAAKVTGTLALDAATAADDLRCFVCFSSVSAELGTVGQTAYCAANAFLNAFSTGREAARSRGERRGVTVSIGWPYLLGGGMRIDDETASRMREGWGLEPLDVTTMCRALEAAVASGRSHVLPLAGDRDRIQRTFDLVPATMPPMALPVAPAEKKDELRRATETWLVSVVAETLHADPAKVLAAESFASLGVDSILMLQLVRAFEKELGQLPKTLFFEFEDLDALTGYFVAEHGAALQALLGVVEPEPAPEPITVVETHETSCDEPIAIIGLSGRYPEAPDLDSFWRNLRVGRDSVREVPADRWDHSVWFDPEPGTPGKAYARWGGFLDGIQDFDPLFFGITPRDAAVLDPQVRLFLEESWRAFEDAGLTRDALRGQRVGVFAAAMYGMYELLQTENDGVDVPVSSSLSAIANRVSYFMNFTGPSLTVDSMCSSSLSALHLGCQSIRQGESDIVLVGGVNLTVHPNKLVLLSQGRFAARDGRCRAFGADGSGYVPGEGVGALVLKPLGRAIADGDPVRAVIRASVVNSGGHTSGFTVPNPVAQAALVREGLDRAGVRADSIGYVEAHGTGTQLGDPIEVEALTKAFRNDTQERGFCSLGSVKTNIGHCEAAAGVAALTKVLLQLQHRELVPSLHADVPNPNIDFASSPFVVQRALEPWPAGPAGVRRAAVSAFGAGGANAHVIVEEFSSDEAYSPVEERLFVFSARDGGALNNVLGRFADWLERGLRADSIITRLSELTGVDAELIQPGTPISELGLASFEAQRLVLEFAPSGTLPPLDGSSLTVADLTAIVADAMGAAPNLAAVAHTLQSGREAMPCRLAVVATRGDELLRTLRAHLAGQSSDAICGTAPSNRRELAAALEAVGGTQAMKALALERDLAALGRAWVSGAAVPWELLYPGGLPRRVALPTYPFARERCWAVRVPTPTHGAPRPLLGERSETPGGCEYRCRLSAEEFFLADHVIGGASVLPAAVHLELMRSALADSGVAGDLSDVILLAPVRVTSKSVTLTVTVVQERPGTTEIEVLTMGADGERQVHARASAVSTHDDRPIESLEVIRSRCRSGQLPGEDCYRSFTDLGLNYGPRHRVLDHLALGEGEVLARIILPDTLRHGLERFGFHPALLDGALQAMLGLGSPNSSGAAELPFALGSVQLLAPMAEGMWAHLRRSSSSTGLSKVDITLYDDAGIPCVLLTDVAFRAVAGPEVPQPSGLVFETCWKSASAANGPAIPLDRWHIVGLNLDRELVDRLSELPDLKVTALTTTCETEAERYTEHAVALIGVLKRELSIPAGTRLVQLVLRGTEDTPMTGLLGMLRSFRLEEPSALIQVLIVDESMSADQAARAVVDERRCPEDDCVWLGGTRRALTWRELKLPASAAIRWHDNGTWLITGGAGGLGRLVALDLARHTANARLVLIGRSEPSESTSTLVASLRAAGADASYHRADVTSVTEMRDLVAQLGTVSGVVHCAGTVRDCLILGKTDEGVAAVLRPKTIGIEVLDEVTRREPIRDFIVFSSLAGAIGNFGQADYAAGNAYCDRFAQRRRVAVARGERSGRTQSIGWALWEGGGMGHGTVSEEGLAQVGLSLLDDQLGLELLHRLATVDSGHVVVLTGITERLRAYVAGQSRNALPSLPDDSSVLSDRLLGELCDLVSDRTGIDRERLDARAPLDALGIDSIIIMDLTAQLEKKLGPLPRTVFFDNGSLAELADSLVADHPAECVAWLGTDGVPLAAARQSVELPVAEPARETSPDIAIIGVAGRYPKSPTLEALWENLREGRDCVTSVPSDRWDQDQFYDTSGVPGTTNAKWGGFIDNHASFDSLFFGISPSEAEVMDPQERVFLECVHHAIEDAGYTPETLSPQDEDGLPGRVGVFVGAMYLEYQLYGAQAQTRGDIYTTNGSAACISNRVSYTFGFHGPSLTLDTMCSSSLVAIHLAVQSLRSGDADVAVAGGVNLSLHPNKFITLGMNHFASPTGRCHSFGADADGYVPSEGVGALILKPLDAALRDGDHIHAVIKGTAVNSDGRTNGFTAPSSIAQTAVIRKALRQAAVHPRDISYVEAHGTGTRLGDPIEVTALTRAFEDAPTDGSCFLGSVKSNLGHCESAAGMASVAKVLLQLKHKQLVPSIHCERLSPEIDFTDSSFTVSRRLRDWTPRNGRRLAGVSAFGAGGTNAHVVIAEAPGLPEVQRIDDGEVLIVLSAMTTEALERQLGQLAEWIRRETPDAAVLADVAYTLQIGRRAHEERFAAVAKDAADLLRRLENPTAGQRGSVGESAPPAREAEVAAAIRSRDLAALARLWVLGAQVSWRELHRDGRRRVSLPGYPFEVRHHWRPTADLVAPSHGRPTGPDPVLRNESSLFEQRYVTNLPAIQSLVRPSDLAAMWALPLVLACRAGEAGLERSHARLTDIAWLQSPLPDTEVITSLWPDDDSVLIQVGGSSKEVGFEARIAMDSGVPSAEPPMELQSVKERCSAVLPGTETGSSRVREVWLGMDEAICVLGGRSDVDEESRFLNLLSGLMEAMELWLTRTSGMCEGWCPESADEIALFQSPVGDCLAHLKRRGACIDIDVTDLSGQLVARFNNIRVHEEALGVSA